MSYYVLLKICHDPDEASTGRKSHHKAKIQAKVFPHLSQLFKDLGSLPPTTLNRGPARGWTSPTANELWKSLYSSSRLMVKQATSKRRSVPRKNQAERASSGASRVRGSFPSVSASFSSFDPPVASSSSSPYPTRPRACTSQTAQNTTATGRLPARDDGSHSKTTRKTTRGDRVGKKKKPLPAKQAAAAAKAKERRITGIERVMNERMMNERMMKGAAAGQAPAATAGPAPLDDTPADGDDAMVLDEPFPPPHMGLALRPKRTTALAVENLTLRSPRIGTLPSGGDSSPATQRQQRNNGPTTKAFVGQQQQRQRQHSGNGVGKRTTTSGPAVARLKKDGARLRAGAMAPWEMSPVLAGGVRLETIR